MNIFILKTWVHYYVALLKKLGAFRFSLILAVAIITADSILQILLGYYFNAPLDIVDISRSFILGLIITPWAVYFLTVVVGDLEDARQRLGNTVAKLQVMLKNDQEKTDALECEIIEHQKSQRQLEETAILLRSFLDTSPNLFFHRDLKGCFVSCNKAMEELAGKTEEQLIGLTPFDIYPESYARQVVERDLKTQETNQEQINEHWLHYPNGRQAYFEVRALPLYNSHKKCVGIIGFGRDITERKKYQESLEKASRDKTTFIATISHELRTPLNGIVGLSRMLLDENLTSEQIKYLKTIHISAITLGNIFNDIIDLDKLDRRRLNLVSNHINMPDFITDLKSLAFIQTEQKGLALRFQQKSLLPNYITADDTRLRQVLWNLITNAVKFTVEGTVTIDCYSEAINETQGLLTFEVQDTGIGIPTDQLEKIFAMYYQVKGNRHATGTGIGLAVSAQIVKAMGGTLTVQSTLGEGSLFKLSIPVECSETNHNNRLISHSLPTLSILLVEDIDLNIVVAKALLEKLGHHVDSAINGQEALDKVANNKYQLILMDIQLPDMDGYQVTQALRHRYVDDLPPIVALTANVFADKQKFIEQGMDDALGKPLGIESFNEMIVRLFTNQKKEDNSDMPIVINDVNETIINEPMLCELFDFLPTSVMLENVALFAQMIPDYLQILDSNIIAKDKKGIVSEAHKIKGAAASVGLIRLQELAQKIQSPELPAWWDNIDDWHELFKSSYEGDIDTLKKWIVSHGK
ncbi:aerobic respiration two-component sensor histidine kinase ArcB [Psychromonas sp. MME1]|uniref:aerobic respiration two-component sensor histidine kinase ArcB n=2 Tax=unclassified Psychromonas TaxID=2614957 RepID=UPI0034E2C309